MLWRPCQLRSHCGPEATLFCLAGRVSPILSVKVCAIPLVLAPPTNLPLRFPSSLRLLFCPCPSSLFSVLPFLSHIWQELFILSSCFFSMGLQWEPGHLFVSGNNTAHVLAKQMLCLSHLQSHAVSLLLPLASTLLQGWRRTI